MLVAAGQPYFAPFAGFFYRVWQADAFVVLDRVQFPRGATWVTRNRFKHDQGVVWITVPVWRKHLGLQRVDRVRICNEIDWIAPQRRTLTHAYARAPYIADHRPFLDEMLDSKWERVVDLNLEIMRYLMKALGLDTTLYLQSHLSSRTTGVNLLIDICRELDADSFLAQASARKHLDQAAFSAAGLALHELQIPTFVYPQLWGDFIANLSVFDMLLNCGPKSRDIITGHRPRIRRVR